MERVDAFERLLQRAWDRFLSRKPVLLILIGSDLPMMEALNSYERPFHQRGTEMVIGPLNPREIQRMLGRGNDVEIDVVGADRGPIAEELRFLGSVKWLENAPFDDHDFAALARHRAALTDEPVPLVALSRDGVACSGLAAAYDPDDLMRAWS
ncbi:hypothetical protein [Planobispora longispora]|uniref:Uncharacterized protein n=1 Tax=Planobispora longispora TaxID=28887 RepID=A0A8J3W6P1_9ACTN|nr:hypothetical protein [Planobispora longispora]BFE83054.1 hypothetical protein GCM10020093_056550 [Planobispora longispora]GIH78724.1 hypothetical protein Plo01_51530 [Planobispora longispora]